jgi:hypothetical protein
MAAKSPARLLPAMRGLLAVLICVIALLAPSIGFAAAYQPPLPTHLTDGQLPPSSYETFAIAPLKKPKVVWLNLPLLKEYGFDVENGRTKKLEAQVLEEMGWVAVDDTVKPGSIRPERANAHTDYYGGGGLEDNVGGARSGSFGPYQIKGIGKTPMLKSANPKHTARAGLYEAVADVIWGEVTHQELPYGGNRIIALIDRGVKTEAGEGPEILEVRQLPLRLGNFMRRNEKTDAADAKRTSDARLHLDMALPKPGNIPARKWLTLSTEERLRRGLKEFALRAGSQHGKMYILGFYHGTNSQSNIELNGKLLDFVTATAQPGYAPITLLKDVLPFGMEHEQSRTAMIDKALDEFAQSDFIAKILTESFPRGAKEELTEIYERAFLHQEQMQVLEYLGLPSHLIPRLIQQYPKGVESLVNLTKLESTEPISVSSTNIGTLPRAKIFETIRKIHRTREWTVERLQTAGIKNGAADVLELLNASVEFSPEIKPTYFRKMLTLKAAWYAKPREYLYVDDYRNFASLLTGFFAHGHKWIVDETIDTILSASRRKIKGLKPFEVPVSINRIEGDPFSKEITTYNAQDGKFQKLLVDEVQQKTKPIATEISAPRAESVSRADQCKFLFLH